MLKRLKRRMKTSGRSESTLHNYSRHLAQMALHFNCLPTEIDIEQVEDYLYLLQRFQPQQPPHHQAACVHVPIAKKA